VGSIVGRSRTSPPGWLSVQVTRSA
jgi:hypothetical protein